MKKLKVLMFHLSLMLCTTMAKAQGPAPPTGFVNPTAFAAMGPNGLFAYTRIDGSGNFATSGNPGLQQIQGSVNPFAPVAVDPNGNWQYFKVDAQGNLVVSGSGAGITITTVAGLATVPGKTNGTVAVVTNGTSSTDCTVGGGATVVNCQFNGATWAQLVGASSGSTAFSSVSPGTNTLGAFHIGTGSSLDASGTGTVSANQVNAAVVPLSASIVGTDASRHIIDVTGTFTFAGVNAGTNTNALLVGAGGSLGPTSTGTIKATDVFSGAAFAPTADGKVGVNTTNHLPVFGSNGATLTWPSFQINSSNITTPFAGLNVLTSSTNSMGITLTPSNPATSQLRFEASGTVNATSGGTGIDSHTATGVAQAAAGVWSISALLPTGLTIPSASLTNSSESGLTLSDVANGANQCLQAGSAGGVGGTGNPCTPPSAGANFSVQQANGSGGFTAIAPQSTNGNYILTANVSGSAAVAGTWNLAGVPVEATNPATLLYSDRANYIIWTSGTALALPPISGQFASNFVFSLKNATASNLVVTPNVGANDLCDGAVTCTIPPGYFVFFYQDGTSAPGHWFTSQVPTVSVLPGGVNVAGINTNHGLAAATGHNLSVPAQCLDSSGSGSAYVCTTSPTFVPANGDCINFETTTTNTGTSATVNVNSAGAAAIQKYGSSTIVAGDILLSKPVELCLGASATWNMMSLPYNAPSGSGNTTSTALTTNTVPKSNGATSLINSLFTDDGTNGAYTGTGTFTSAGPLASTNGTIEFTGNASPITVPTNQFAWGGFSNTSSAAYGLKPSNTAPTTSQILYFPAPDGTTHWSQGTWMTVTDTTGAGIVTGPTTATNLNVVIFDTTTGKIKDSGVQGGAVCASGVFAAQTDSATVTWALASKACGSGSLTFTVHGGTRTLNITNPQNGGRYVLWIKQDSTGGEGLVLGTGCVWKVANGGAGAISLSAGANAIDFLRFWYDGTNCYAVLDKNFS